MQTLNSQPLKIAHEALFFALKLKRPHGGIGVKKLMQFLVGKLPTHRIDAFGNIHVDMRSESCHKTLFVAHMDTVHSRDGVNRYRFQNNLLKALGAPLGADDGAGMAILFHLIQMGKPGYYIFTQGEECGGLGAKYLTMHDAELLAQFDRAIAFDRRGDSSVITHQMFGRCCSDAFAAQLSHCLNDLGLLYMPDDTGSYTDTAEFVDIIPECTNISCGYLREHSDKEILNMTHFDALCKAACMIDWDGLAAHRDPKDRSEYAFESSPDYWHLDTLQDPDPMKYELLDAVDTLSWSADDRSLKRLLLTVVRPDQRHLIEAQLQWLPIPDEVVDLVYDNIHNCDSTSLLSAILEMSEPSLVS